MLVSPKEEKIFRWVESDECLGSKVISKEASVLDQSKYQFCQTITRYQVQNNLTERKIANLLGLVKLSTAKLLRGYVENFALDSLISYVEKLNIPCQVKITSEDSFASRKTANGRTLIFPFLNPPCKRKLSNWIP